MAGKGRQFTHKLTAAERRRVAERYWLYLRNMPKVISAEHGINPQTVRKYAREFRF